MRSFYVFTQRVSLRVHTSKYGGIKLISTYVQCNSFHRGIKRNAGKSDLVLPQAWTGPDQRGGVTEQQTTAKKQTNQLSRSDGGVCNLI